MKKKPKLLRYLLYLALVTTVISSVTLARYASGEAARGDAEIAAFVTAETISFDTAFENMTPGAVKSVYFNVTNFQGDTNSDVDMTYEVELETTGNLPLSFSLLGEKEEGDADPESALVGSLDSQGKATGGKLPIAESSAGRHTHRYRLNMEWPAGEKNQSYSEEIDMVTVKITSKQVGIS